MGQTVAIVDAYDDPKAEADLARYRSRYGIAGCTTGDGCFRKANQTGGTSYPTANPGWAVEISLDLDMVSAACPNCHILLVEASSNSNGNLYAAENEAVGLGASEVSNSCGSQEEPSELSSDSYFNHEGVPVTAAAGDSGYDVEYPAASPYVIAVGGTALTQASNARGWSETTWGGTGSGCSAYEPKPTWQTESSLCAARINNDVAAVASPETPVSVADSYTLPSGYSRPEAGWTLVGGTSVGSPLVAGTMALANAYSRSLPGAEALYREASQNGTGVLDDVVSGGNGSCGNQLCEAGPGYDGPTGLGSPDGAPVVVPNAPTVMTGMASSVTQTTATLNATVNPNGGELSECEIEYGSTTAYESSTPCTPAPGSGTSPVAVSVSVTSLAAGATYHFRVVAANAGATSRGSDQSFKTLVNPPAVVTGQASSLTRASASLNATVNPEGGPVTDCRVEYGTTISYGSNAPCSPLPGSGTSPVRVSASVTGLAVDTTYHYRIVATNPGGSSTGSDETFKTLPNPPTVETTVASSITKTSAALNARVNPNGAEVTDCALEYGASASYESSVACTPAPGSGTSPVAVLASVTGLAVNTTYHFRIVATNPGGSSTGSDETFKTLPNPPTVETTAASSVTQATATLNATVDPQGGEVSECEIEYGTSTSYESSAPCTPSPGSGTIPVGVSASVTGLAVNTIYHYRTVAANSGGSSEGSDETFRTLPNPPTVVTGTASSLTQTTATLNATVNPNGGELSECEIEYGTTVGYESIAPCAAPLEASGGILVVAAQVHGLSAATTYHFRVGAANPGGTSYGLAQTLTTLAPTTLPQLGPGGQETLPGLGVPLSQDQAPPPVPDAELAGATLTVGPSGIVNVKVKCPAAKSSCAGTVTLRTLNAVIATVVGHRSRTRKAAVLTLASSPFRVAGGRVQTLALRLSAAARKLLATTDLLRARATIIAHYPTGPKLTTQTIVTLRVPKDASHHRRR